MSMGVQRILVADGHPLVRQGVRSLLEDYPQLQVVAEAATAREALEGVRSLIPDILIIDIALPDLNGIGLVKTIKAELPDTQIVIFTICKCEELIGAAMRAGASSYVVKADSGSDLLSSLQALSAA